MVFLIRERANNSGLTKKIINIIMIKFGLDILESSPLPQESLSIVAKKIRGGKWDKGPYRYSGGLPVHIIVALDYYAKPASSSLHPRVTNQNLLNIKKRCRKLIAETLLLHKHYNPLHTADNEAEAMAYIQAALPNRYQAILKKSAKLRQRYFTDQPVLQVFSQGRRAKVELIAYNGQKAVKKTFRVGMERYLERELFASKELSRDLPFIPPLLEEGDGYIIRPFYENIMSLGKFNKSQISPAIKAKIASIVAEFYNRDLTLIDFSANNTIMLQSGEIIVLDFEFLQHYKEKPVGIFDAYEVKGVPRSFTGDLPFERNHINSKFKVMWRGFGTFKSCFSVKNEY